MANNLKKSITVKDFVTALDTQGVNYKVETIENTDPNVYPRHAAVFTVVSSSGVTLTYYARTKKGSIDGENILHFGKATALLDGDYVHTFSDRDSWSEHKLFMSEIRLK